MAKKIGIWGLFILLTTAFSPLLFSYDVPLPEDEASPTLFSLSPEDDDTDFYLEGTWNFTLTGGFGFGYSPGRGFFSGAAPANITPGFGWEQVPDLTLSLWLFDKYFLETSFSQEWEDSTFLLGMVGDEGDLVNRVHIGNTAIDMDSYAGVKVSKAPQNGLGVAGRFTPPRSVHEVLLRFDPTERRTQVFIGTSRVEESSIDPASFIRGRFFYLPGTAGENLVFYRETSDSGAPFSVTPEDNRRYLPVDPGEYLFDPARGLLIFREPLKARVLVAYPGIPAAFSFTDTGPSWAPGNSQDLKTVTLSNGTETRLLWSPGEFSPLEVNRCYPIEASPRADDLGSARVTLTSRSDPDGPGSPLPWSLIEPGILSLGEGSGAPGSLKFHYPLHDFDSGSRHYGPDDTVVNHPEAEDPDYPPLKKSEATEILRLQILESSDSYGLDNPLPGSVTLKINGVAENRFTLEGSRLTINRPVYPNDRIEISYHTAGSAGGGDLLWSWGSRFFPDSGLTLEAGAGLRWNLFGGTYTNRENQSPGSLQGALQGRYDSDYLKAELAGGLSLNNPDTTGSFRLLGMEEEGFALPLSRYNVYPAAPDASSGYPAASRGILKARDYYVHNLLGGSVLQDYTSPLPEDRIYPYEEGNPVGPYLATAGSDGRGGQVAVLEAEWEPGEWVGVQIPLRPPNGAGRDFSSVRTLNLPWRWVGAIPDDITIVVELGTLGEDLDGDGRLDQEASEYSAGFSFYDEARGLALTYGGGSLGGGNGFLDSEDTNGNGLLDGDNPYQTVMIEVAPASTGYPGADWDYIRLPLNGEQRQKLTSVTAVRIRAVHEGMADTRIGKLLVGDLFFEGSPFLVDGDPAGLDISGIYEGHLPEAERPDRALENRFPEVLQKFHPAGERQKILRHQWDSPADSSWSLTAYVPPALLSSYSALSFYLRAADLVETGPGALFRVDLTGPGGTGLTASFPAAAVPSGEWQKITVDYGTGRVLIGGDAVPEGTVSLTPSSTPVTTLGFAMTNTTGGTVFIDEIHLHDPVLSAALSGRGLLEYRLPGVLFSWGKTALASDPFIRLEGSASGEQFDTTQGSSGLARWDGRGEAGITLLEARFESAWEYRNQDGVTGWGGEHSLKLPLGFWGFTMTDRFSLASGGGENSFSRGTGLSLQPHSSTRLQAESAAVYSGATEELSQIWEGSWTVKGQETFSLDLSTRWGLLTSGEISETGSYADSWFDGYRLLFPREDGTPRQRKMNVKAAVSAAVGRTAPVLAVAAESFNILDREDPEQTLEAKGDLKVPIRLGSGPASWLMTPSYGRSLRVRTEKSGHDFAGDLSLAGTLLNKTLPLGSAWPGEDLFSSSLFEEMTRLGGEPQLLALNFQPSWGLALSRPVGSWLSNLYLPTGLDFLQKRTLNWKDGTGEDLLSTELTLRYSFLNLFGRLGAYSRFGFYETEEVVNLLKVKWVTDQENQRQEELQFSLQNYSFMRLSSRNSLEFSGAGTFSRADDESLRLEGDLTWVRRRPLPPINLPSFLPENVLKAGELHHSEGLSGDVRRGETENKTTLTLTHETAVVLATGRIGVFITFSTDMNHGAEPFYLFGIQGGITGKFSF